MNQISYWIVSALAVVMAITVHEWGHALASDLLGDPTPRRAGRVSLNPLRHLDPVGTLALLFFRVGWAKPVPVDWRYYKNPRLGMVLTSLAGVGMNLLTAFLFSFGLVFMALHSRLSPLGLQAGLSFVAINCALVVCNLMPIPPLDGFRFWAEVLPRGITEPIKRFSVKIGLYQLVYGSYGSMVCLVILMLFGRVLMVPLMYRLSQGVWNSALRLGLALFQ